MKSRRGHRSPLPQVRPTPWVGRLALTNAELVPSHHCRYPAPRCLPDLNVCWRPGRPDHQPRQGPEGLARPLPPFQTGSPAGCSLTRNHARTPFTPAEAWNSAYRSFQRLCRVHHPPPGPPPPPLSRLIRWTPGMAAQAHPAPVSSTLTQISGLRGSPSCISPLPKPHDRFIEPRSRLPPLGGLARN